MKILIKKAHFILYILLTCGFYESIYSQDCGTWVKDTIYYENWIDVDTINYNPKANTTWTYTEWRFVLNPERTYAIFCPCGCGYADWEIRKRVNAVGIIQQQKRVTTYKYIESKFEKRLRSLKTGFYKEEKK